LATLRIALPTKIFYGWYIVILAFLVQFAVIGSQGFSLGVFMKPMTEDLGWSRSDIASVHTIGTIIGGFLALFIGPILDRRGARPLVIVGAILSGLGFLALSMIQELWHFYAIRGLIITVGSTCASIMVLNTAVSNWFIRKRGRAVTFGAMGVPFAGIALIPIIQILIESFTWRNAWIILGVMIWVVAIIPTAMFMRRRPEDVGLVPDGAMPTEEGDKGLSSAQRAALAADVTWTRSEAIRTSTLWMIIGASGLGSMTLTATMMHLVPYVSDMGFSLQIAALTASVHSWFSLISKFGWGFIIERIHARFVIVIAYSLAASGLAVLLFARSLETIVLGMAVLGLGIGGVTPVTEVIWASYFGRRSLGAVRSIGAPFTILTYASAPLIPALIYDSTKSYNLAFVFLIGTLVIGASLMLLLRPARRPQAKPEALAI
jgi:MFS family permease